MTGLGHAARRPFRDHGAARRDPFHELGVLGRVGHIDARGDHRDRRAGRQRTLVRRGVDAAGQAGDHHQPSRRQLARQAAGQHPAVAAGVARTDEGHARQVEKIEIAAHREDRRRVGDLGEALRIAGLAMRDQPSPELLQRLELGLGVLPPAAAQAVAAAHLRRQTRQLLVGAPRAAEATQKLKKSPRADPVGATQLQPVELLCGGKCPRHDRRACRSCPSWSTDR
jgi:hypothetical protein